MLWLIFAVMILAVLAALLVPLLRRRQDTGASRVEHDLTVYRDQLAEVEDERRRGVLDEAEAAAARLEVERRMLRAADRQEAVGSGERWRMVSALAVAALVPAFATATYVWLGQPELPAQPLASRPASSTQAAAGGGTAGSGAAGDIASMVQRLEARLASAPDDAQGWMLLGRSYLMLEQFDSAVSAYRRASELSPGDAIAHMGHAEAQVFAAEGAVTPAAVAGFRRALEIEPQHPGARYYLALARAQAGDTRAAFDGWLALAADSPADAPWQPALQARLREAADILKIDLASVLPSPPPPRSEPTPRPGPGPSAADMAAAAEMSPEQRGEMIRGMVDRLAERLAGNPDDFDGWMRLGRAYQVLGQPGDARQAYERAAALRPQDPAARQALAAPGDGGEAPPAPAAGTGSAPEQAEMIRGMVDRLAARLAENPDDFDGWMRLGRARSVLGEFAAAREAYARASALRPGDVDAVLGQAAAVLETQPGEGPLLPEAETLFRQALALQPDNLDALWFVGVAEVQAGRPQVAIAHWERLLGRLDPRSREHADVRAGIEAVRKQR